MNVSAYILANKSQEVPVPIPVDPVEATITASANIGFAYNATHYSEEPIASVDFSASNTFSMEDDSISGETGVEQGFDCPPCNASHSDGWVSLYIYDEALFNGRHYVADDFRLYTTSGSFTIDVSGLDAGKYVFEVTHWIGAHDNSKWNANVYTKDVQIVGNKGRVIKSGTHGAIEGIAYPEVVTYAGWNWSEYQSPRYMGRVIKVVIRYAFTVQAGATTKTFAWGDNADISLRDLWNYVKIFDVNSDGSQGSFSNWFNTHFTSRAKLYTGG